MTELVVLSGNAVVGRVVARGARLSFSYDEAWRRADDAHSISLSMPLLLREHTHRVVSAFLWGLLPDSDLVLQRWARRFHVSHRNPFALLTHVGDDCAGALRFVTATRLEAATQNDGIETIDEADIAVRLRELRRDRSTWHGRDGEGRFSLAGAQPKTALWFDGRRWGVPRGRTPTTHILKPGIVDLDEHAENEHLCLATARALGLPSARSRIMHFEDEVAIVVERYDRPTVDGVVMRAHQEDLCQALGIHPSQKYENDGGPGARSCVDVLREHSGEPEADVRTFVRALGFNWLIGGTDAHAKNYAVLIGRGDRVRLAPLYDVASALPYFDSRKLRSAMKIGGTYRMHDVGRHQWAKLAQTAGLDASAVHDDLRTLATQLPDAVATERARLNEAGLAGEAVDRLSVALAERAEACRRILEP